MKNPQAFPTHPDGALINDGMTLRDYFAARAMQGLVSKSSYDFTDIAKCAYLIADAMLKAREA
jgi:hypothetical protein